MKKYTAVWTTKQIHKTAAIKKVCHVTSMNSYECSSLRAWFLRVICGYDGCGHCYPERSKKNGR